MVRKLEKIFLYNLGCPKNYKDTELVLNDFLSVGFEYTNNIEEASVIMVNTCAFIDSAKEESIHYIMEAVELKKRTGAKLIVNGCLPELYIKDLKQSIPEVDFWLGSKNVADTLNVYLDGKKGDFVSHKRKELFLNPKTFSVDAYYDIFKNELGPFSAYVKISEGCSSSCTFCIIPKIRGNIVYRNINDILAEIELLVQNGVLEIVLIAQDLTYNVAFLKEILLSIDTLRHKPHWVRLLYCNPWGVDEELVKIILDKEYIIPYIDFPIQHISDSVLKSMNRPTREGDIRHFLDIFIKHNITVRSSVIVGFPTETEDSFARLKSFVEEGYFHWLGIFPFSPQDGTVAAGMPQLPEEVIQDRYNELDEIQFNITRLKNSSFIGKSLEILPMDGREDNLFVGRTFFQAPEIDGVSFFKNKLNKLAKCKVIDTNGIDIYCELV